MSNVYSRIVNLAGDGGGGGALIVATRSDNGNPAVFADFAALETYTATTEGTNDANSINVSDQNDAMEVFGVGTLTGGQVATLTAAYIRLNNAWVAVATNLVGTPGTPGTPGQDGLDGNTLEFTSISARDVFFTANPDMLRTNLPIMVTVGTRTVSNQVWEGADSPSSYNAATDASFWMDASIRVGTSSLDLGDIHTISSGGENIFITNHDSNLNYFPAWQFVGDHRSVEGRVVSSRPTARVYGDLDFSEPNGAVATGGAVDYDMEFTLTRTESVFNFQVVAAETYTGQIQFRVTRMGTTVISFDFFDDVVKVPGDTVSIWFDIPVEGFIGSEIRVELLKPDGSYLQVRPAASDAAIPYTGFRFREFSDQGLAYLDDTVPNFVEVTADINITNDNLDTYNRRTLYIAQDTNLLGVDREVNLAAGLNDFEYLDIVNFNPTDIRISVGTGFDGDINGEHDIRLAQFEGGRIIKEPNEDNYAFIFDNTDPDMVDNFVDTFTASVSGQDLTMTLGRTGSLADLTQTVTLPGATPATPTFISVSSDLTITGANLSTHEGSVLYVPSSYVGVNDITVTVTVDLSFSHIAFANFSTLRNLVLRSTDAGQINDQISVTLAPTHGARLVDEPGAGGNYYLIFDSVSDLPESVTGALRTLINNTGERIPAGQPVIAVVTPTGVLQMERASHTNVCSGTDTTAQGGAIYGFVTEDVADGR